MTGLQLKPGTSWWETYARCVAVAPEAFESDRLLNLFDGRWQRVGRPGYHVNPVDGSSIQGPPQVDRDTAAAAVDAAVRQHADWGKVELDERKERVTAAVDMMAAHRDLLALLLVWEIGKPWRLACADVDRGLDGVRWYVEEIDRQLGATGRRKPLPGPVSNIASWNYPVSVQVHAELVQALAGNAVVAKTPSQGGFHCLTLAHAFMARAGLPVTLLSGAGSKLGDVLISSAGHRGAGVRRRPVQRPRGGHVAGRPRAPPLPRAGGPQRLGRVGLHPVAAARPAHPQGLRVRQAALHRLPALRRAAAAAPRVPGDLPAGAARPAFRPPARRRRPRRPAARAGLRPGDLRAQGRASSPTSSTRRSPAGRFPLYRGSLGDGRFVPGQDTAAYVAPAAVLEPPTQWSLHHAEPFGPLDSVVCVDTEAEFLAAMNASNGCLVASIATDDPTFGARAAEQLQAFKVGVNKPRSRGDREEVFGGIGESWKGAFVGGDLLVHAVTVGPEGDAERLYGNFPNYSLYPDR